MFLIEVTIRNYFFLFQMEIKNLESSIVGNASEIKELQQELSRQTEIIYNVVSDKPKFIFYT